jgi:hypothetical protein
VRLLLRILVGIPFCFAIGLLFAIPAEVAAPGDALASGTGMAGGILFGLSLLIFLGSRDRSTQQGRQRAEGAGTMPERASRRYRRIS